MSESIVYGNSIHDRKKISVLKISAKRAVSFPSYGKSRVKNIPPSTKQASCAACPARSLPHMHCDVMELVYQHNSDTAGNHLGGFHTGECHCEMSLGQVYMMQHCK